MTDEASQREPARSILAARLGGEITVGVIVTAVAAGIVAIREELLFRGLATTALPRYEPFVGVVGGAIFFALLHGISIVFPAAVVACLVAGEIFRRSGLVWRATALAC